MVNRRDLLKTGAGAAIALGFATDLALGQQDQAAATFMTGLTGDQRPESVDTPAEGAAVFVINEDGTSMDYALAVSDITDATMAHIHVGPAGESGPVAIWLYPGPETRSQQLQEGTFSGILANGTVTADHFGGPLEGESFDALLERMRAGETFTQVHTEANPGGEIRGQNLPVREVMGPALEAFGGGQGTPQTASPTPGTEQGPAQTVAMVNTTFDPVRASVEPGSTVEWVNEDSFEHDVTAAQFHDVAADWDFSETLAGGERTTFTFEEAGIYEYYCTIHGESTMCGAVIVGDASLDAALPCESGGGGDGSDGGEDGGNGGGYSGEY